MKAYVKYRHLLAIFRTPTLNHTIIFAAQDSSKDYPCIRQTTIDTVVHTVPLLHNKVPSQHTYRQHPSHNSLGFVPELQGLWPTGTTGSTGDSHDKWAALTGVEWTSPLSPIQTTHTQLWSAGSHQTSLVWDVWEVNRHCVHFLQRQETLRKRFLLLWPDHLCVCACVHVFEFILEVCVSHSSSYVCLLFHGMARSNMVIRKRGTFPGMNWAHTFISNTYEHISSQRKLRSCV